jgi:hypothetical protein
MRSIHLFSLAALALAVSPAFSAPTPVQAATCVAALKARAEPLAQRLREGDGSAEAELLPVVIDSFAFIGTSYKQGVESAQANELLRAAEARQAQLPKTELARMQDACQAEGRHLLEQANGFERMFVHRAAQSRVDRFKRPR